MKIAPGTLLQYRGGVWPPHVEGTLSLVLRVYKYDVLLLDPCGVIDTYPRVFLRADIEKGFCVVIEEGSGD